MNRFLDLLLLLVLVGGLVSVGYVVLVPRTVEPDTEFYLLGPTGKAESYPVSIRAGEEVAVTLGIVNREGRRMSYRVKVLNDGVLLEELSPGILEADQGWERGLQLKPTMVGKDQQVRFLLFKNGEETPSLELRLWLEVKPSLS